MASISQKRASEFSRSTGRENLLRGFVRKAVNWLNKPSIVDILKGRNREDVDAIGMAATSVIERSRHCRYRGDL